MVKERKFGSVHNDVRNFSEKITFQTVMSQAVDDRKLDSEVLDIVLDETWHVDWNNRKMKIDVKNGNYFWALNVKVTLYVEVVEDAIGEGRLQVRWNSMAGIRKDSYENIFSLEQLQRIYDKKKHVVQSFFGTLDSPKHQR